MNFEPEDIKVNASALEEIVRMKKESLFFWQQSLIELNGNSMCPFSIRSWNGHLEHFLIDKIYSTYSGLFFFTKTNISSSLSKHINEIVDD